MKRPQEHSPPVSVHQHPLIACKHLSQTSLHDTRARVPAQLKGRRRPRRGVRQHSAWQHLPKKEARYAAAEGEQPEACAELAEDPPALMQAVLCCAAAGLASAQERRIICMSKAYTGLLRAGLRASLQCCMVMCLSTSAPVAPLCASSRGSKDI